MKDTGEYLRVGHQQEDVTVDSGAFKDTTITIPDRAILLAVNVRVLTAVTGASSFDVGISGETSKFGGSIGIGADSTNIGVIGPTAFYSDTPVRLSANGSDFTGGVILQMQMEQQRQGHMNRLEEINVQADIAESRALYRTYNTGVRWVDSLNGTVRPVIAYAFFLLYAAVKIMAYQALPESSTISLSIIYDTLWTQEDAAIFAGIISFYFGQRAMNKIRGQK